MPHMTHTGTRSACSARRSARASRLMHTSWLVWTPPRLRSWLCCSVCPLRTASSSGNWWRYHPPTHTTHTHSRTHKHIYQEHVHQRQRRKSYVRVACAPFSLVSNSTLPHSVISSTVSTSTCATGAASGIAPAHSFTWISRWPAAWRAMLSAELGMSGRAVWPSSATSVAWS